MSVNLKALTTLFIFVIVIMFFLVVDEHEFYLYLNDHWDKTVAFASAIGTVIAAIATWLAARRAADGAEIAKRSMEEAGKAAKVTLQETQLYNRRTSFENRYALLLAQHDQYHKQLCDYIDSEKEMSGSGMKFFDDAKKANDCNAVLSFLTGHEIISRYMRTLYHLLKFVKEDFYLDSGEDCIAIQRKYTSPVRSIIRNDVLFMIALNALNVKTNISKASGYPRYQELLHSFDFFEHAVFIKPLDPNGVLINTEWEGLIHSQINSQLNCDDRKICGVSIFSLPEINIFSPLLACLVIYENPMKESTLNALETFYVKNRKIQYEKRVNDAFNRFNKAKVEVDAIKNGVFKESESDEWKPVTQEIIDTIKGECVFGVESMVSYIFKPKYSDKCSELSGNVLGQSVYINEKSILYYHQLYIDINECGGLSSYLQYLQADYEKKLVEFKENIASYDVNHFFSEKV
ncbi:putative phage abortive infection protein [Citrobacter amalonaticus]|uniref:putative phage abortive infection protein n=1 Tax=Citrobacter amalonaticus TaxID=35703 RepID=UPI00388991B2